VLTGTTPHQWFDLLTDRRGHGLRFELYLLQAPQCSPAGGSVHSITGNGDTTTPLGPAPSSHQIWVLLLVVDAEEPPGSGDAFELVFASVEKFDVRSGDEISDGSGDEYLAGCGV
jgi:hypothetical protein